MLNYNKEETKISQTFLQGKLSFISSPFLVRTSVVLLLLMNALTAFAQPKDNSPYSRLGLGDLVQQQFAGSRGFGGLSAAYQHPFHINVENPASLAYLNSTAFEIGLYSKYANLEDNAGSSTDVWSGNVRYFALAFPLQNPINRELERDRRPFQWGMNIALVPYTQVGYDLQIIDTDPQVDTTINNFIGEGGTNRLIWGNGIRYKNFALGINAGFLFGNISRTTQTQLADVAVSYDNLIENNYSVSGVLWNFGAQYRHNFKSKDNSGKLTANGKSIIFGAYGNGKNNYSTRADIFFRTINQITNDIDTVRLETDTRGKGKLPGEFTFGVMYQDLNKLRVGAEFGIESWSGFTNPVEPVSLENTYSVAVGAEWTPDAKSYNSYAKRMQYRAGFRYNTDPRGTDGSLTYRSLTFGLGFPIISKGTQSFLDWGFEIGSFGEDNGLQESFFRTTVGFTINDSGWFFKRRYN